LYFFLWVVSFFEDNVRDNFIARNYRRDPNDLIGLQIVYGLGARNDGRG